MGGAQAMGVESYRAGNPLLAKKNGGFLSGARIETAAAFVPGRACNATKKPNCPKLETKR